MEIIRLRNIKVKLIKRVHYKKIPSFISAALPQIKATKLEINRTQKYYRQLNLSNLTIQAIFKTF